MKIHEKMKELRESHNKNMENLSKLKISSKKESIISVKNFIITFLIGLLIGLLNRVYDLKKDLEICEGKPYENIELKQHVWNEKY